MFNQDELYRMIQWNTNRPDLALWVIDAFEHLGDNSMFSSILQLLIEVGRRRNCGIIVTIRGDLETIRSLIPWSIVPFFLYIAPKRHRLFRLRAWQSGGSSVTSENVPYQKIYDRFLNFYGYFQEVRWWNEKEKSKRSKSSRSSRKSKISNKSDKSDQS